jgi:hypothetical protein
LQEPVDETATAQFDGHGVVALCTHPLAGASGQADHLQQGHARLEQGSEHQRAAEMVTSSWPAIFITVSARPNCSNSQNKTALNASTRPSQPYCHQSRAAAIPAGTHPHYTRSIRIDGIGRGGKLRDETLEIRSLNNAMAARGRTGKAAYLGFKPGNVTRVL